MSIANVLLVDDEVSFVEAFSERLVMRSLEITKAFSGEEALQVLEKNHNIEVIILDVKMPGMDGIETLVQIKKKLPLVEVIMLSGQANVESAIDGMKQGAFDYLRQGHRCSRQKTRPRRKNNSGPHQGDYFAENLIRRRRIIED